MQQETSKTVHEGRNIKRIREILGIKQEALAVDLGISQQAISALEQKEALDREMLEKVAEALKVPVEAIQNFDEQAAIVYFNTFNDNSFSNSNGTFSANQCTFNPLDKVVELYERLLQSEKEKVQMLERVISEKK